METRLASSPLSPERPPMARPHARMFEVESLEGKQLLSTMNVITTRPRGPRPCSRWGSERPNWRFRL